jgi:hypothetical protein
LNDGSYRGGGKAATLRAGDRTKMNENTQKRESREGATPQARQWSARRRETQAAAEADSELARKQRLERNRRVEQEEHNPVAFALGILGVLLLLVVAWFVLDQMRCDPFYAQVSRWHNLTCK